jgi:3-oxoacyl-[acyl-carrier-protein] synthase II
VLKASIGSLYRQTIQHRLFLWGAIMAINYSDDQRPVITGIGMITPAGTNTQMTWENLVAGCSGIQRIMTFDPKNIGVKVAGQISFNPADHLEPKEARRMSRDSQLAQVAARQAMQDAHLTREDLAPIAERVGTVMGTTLGGYEIGLQQIMPFPEKRIGPFALLNSLPNLPGYYIAREVGAEGPSLTISNACVSGTQAIGEAAGLIRNGMAEVVLAGGVEALMLESLFAGLEAMGVMALGFEDNPTEASKPFDANRSGLVYSEAVAVLVIETLAHAQARGAHIYAEVVGYGASTDITSPAIPDPSAKPGRIAMQMALRNANMTPQEVEYINPHGPGTKGDAVETLAIKQVFGEHAYNIPISSTKSMLGHPMGATGAVETAVCALTIDRGVIHPTINYRTPDPECDLDYVPNQARQADISVAMCNNNALGGHNATVILKRVS